MDLEALADRLNAVASRFVTSRRDSGNGATSINLACVLFLRRSVPRLGAVSAAGVLRANYVPAPSQLAPHLVELLAGGELWRHLSVTLYRLALSFLFALIPAVLLGLSLGMSRDLRLALEPLLTSLYAIPKIALLPLVMLVLGVNERTLIFTSTLTSFVQMTMSTTGGVLAVDRSILEAGKNYGATGWRLFRYVLLPSALPDIFTGMRIGLASYSGAGDRR